MQLTAELHVSTLQGHHQAYKIIVLTKAHAVILPTGSRGLQFQCTLNEGYFMCKAFYLPNSISTSSWRDNPKNYHLRY